MKFVIHTLMKFSSLAAAEVVKMTTSSATSDENCIKMTTFLSQCSCFNFIQWNQDMTHTLHPAEIHVCYYQSLSLPQLSTSYHPSLYWLINNVNQIFYHYQKPLTIYLLFIYIVRLRQSNQQFVDGILKLIFSCENCYILIKISQKYVPRPPIDNSTV